MNHNTHDIHELSYDLAHSRYSINYRSGADGFSSNQIIDDKEKDLNYMYSEFLKNDLDFSELPSHPQNKYEDNFFSLTQPRRNEFGQFGFETNKKSYDPFRPDREFDLEREMYRGRSLSGQFADNFEIPSSNVFQKLSDPMYYQGRHQNEINEVCAQEPAFLNQQSTTDSLSKFQEESLKDLEPSNAFKSQVQLNIMKSEQPRQNFELGVTIHSIKSKMDDDIAPTSSIGDRSEHFSYLQASINLSQPFSMQRKSSANEAQSTQVLSQSSVESPESKKKWVETSGALHAETVKKQKPETQAQSKRGGGKKKLKTSSDVGEEVKPNTSQQMKPETSYNQMKQETSYNQMKQEFSANQFQREVSSHQLKQENSTTKRAQFQNLFESKSNAKQINTMNEGSSDLNHGRSQPNYNNMNALVNSQSSSDLMNNHMTNRPMMPSHLGEHTNYFQSAQTNSKAGNYFPGYGLNNAQEHQQGWHQQNSQQQNSNQYTQQADLRQQQQLQFQRYQQMQAQYYQQQEPQVQKTQNSHPQQSSQQNQYLQQQHLRNNIQKVSQNIQEQQQYPQDQYARNLEQKMLQSQQSQQSQQFLRQPLQQQQQVPPQYSQYHHPRSQEFSQAQSQYNQQQYYQQPQQQGQPHTWQPQQELQQSRSSSNQRMTETHSQNQQESQLNPNQSHQYRQQPHYLNNQQGGQQQPHHFSSQMIQQASHFNAQQHTTSQQQNFQTQNFTPDRQQSSNNNRSDLQVQPIHYQTQQTPHPNTTQQIAPFRESINTQTINPASHPQLPKLNNLRQLQPASITKSVGSLPNKNITQELVKNNLPIQAETVKSVKNTHLLEKIQSSQTRRIGPLTQEERKAKVARYLEKRKQRFRVEKKSYPARKKVASNRPRVKGRFATQHNASQANEINGLSQTQANTHAQDNRNMTTASYENAPVFNSMLDSPFQSLNQDGGKGYLLSSEFDPRYDPFFD